MLRSGLVAIATLAALGASTFGLQAAVLGKQPEAKLELTRTLHWLDDYTVSRATISIAGHHYSVRCHDQWLSNMRISDVEVDGRSSILAVQGRILAETPEKWATFQLAGCPMPLSHRMATQLVHGTPMATYGAKRFGVPVYVVRTPEPNPEFELVVSRKTNLPLELELLGKLKGTSLVRYGVQR